jgi:hypothetical protein
MAWTEIFPTGQAICQKMLDLEFDYGSEKVKTDWQTVLCFGFENVFFIWVGDDENWFPLSY